MSLKTKKPKLIPQMKFLFNYSEQKFQKTLGVLSHFYLIKPEATARYAYIVTQVFTQIYSFMG